MNTHFATERRQKSDIDRICMPKANSFAVRPGGDTSLDADMLLANAKAGRTHVGATDKMEAR